MAFAVFTGNEKLSRTFPTREETLKKADEAGLVDRSKGKPVLEDDLRVKPCPADPEPKNIEDLDWSPKQALEPGTEKA
jgi:hypothetical protein